MKIGALILIILSVFTFSLSGYNLYLVFTHPLKFKEEIVLYAKEYNLSPALVASVIKAESSFNESAKSYKNAIGLMQIKLSTANYLNDLKNENHLTEEELFNAKTNIKYGCEYLNYLMKKFKNVNTVLASYNAGETRVRSWLKSKEYSSDGITLNYIPYKETRNYVYKINKNSNYYSRIFQ